MSNPDPATPTGWASPEVVAAVISFIVSGAISLLSLFLENRRFRQRRVNERKYNTDLYLYQNIAIESATESIGMADQLDQIFETLLASVDSKSVTAAKRRTLVETAIDDFYNVDQVYSKNIVSKSRLYSDEHSNALENIWTDYYDECTKIASRLVAPGNPKLKMQAIRTDKANSKNKFIHALAIATRESHPTID